LYWPPSVSQKPARSPCASGSDTTYAFDVSLNRTTDKIEVTSFGDTSKAYVVSLPDAQGDLAGFWDTDGGQYKLSAAIDGGRKFYLYPTTATTTKYWFGKAHFDISVNSTVSGAIEVSGAWAIAASLLDNGITA